MRPIGFSTGALAYGDFPKALRMLEGKSANAVELSALRTYELPNLVAAADSLNLEDYDYVSVHAPSSFTAEEEPHIIEQLQVFVKKDWPIVLHPDTVHRFDLWRTFGAHLCVENMDKRKPIGRKVSELEIIFSALPDALFCLDLAHSRQVDSSMTESYLLLEKFGPRLRQLHVSEVDSNSKHDRISLGAIRAFQEVADLIPRDVPAIMESIVLEHQIEEELDRARLALRPNEETARWQLGDFAIQH
jgi:hypothetical protein